VSIAGGDQWECRRRVNVSIAEQKSRFYKESGGSSICELIGGRLNGMWESSEYMKHKREKSQYKECRGAVFVSIAGRMGYKVEGRSM
jgi:hypothetical protein